MPPSVKKRQGTNPPERRAPDSAGGDIPVLVRVAGLSARALSIFGSDELGPPLETLDDLHRQLEALYDELIEHLFRELPQAGADERGFLLTLKRDCHNRRSLRRHQPHPLWTPAALRTDGALEKAVSLESEVEQHTRRFEERYLEVRRQELDSLFAAAEERWLLRGLALASPTLVEGLQRHRTRPFRGRKARRLETTLLRYLSRAAFKLSPYSTLTPLALADLHPEDGQPIRFRSGPRRDRSLVRIKRYLLDQCCRLLFRHPEVLARLDVSLNPSLEYLPSGEVRFLRPPRLVRSEPTVEQPGLIRTPAAQVKVRLGGALVPALSELLAEGDLPYRTLVERLHARQYGGDPSELEPLRSNLGKLIDLGFLEAKPPWPGYEPQIEGCLVRFLEALPAAALPASLTGALRDLVELERGFAGDEDPAAAVRSIDTQIVAFYDALTETVDPGESHPPLRHTESRSYYEDVFLTPADPRHPFLLELDERPLYRALAAGDLIWRLKYLFEPRHELLFTLGRHLQLHHQGHRHVPVAQLFAETRGLWGDYQRHIDERRPGLFDPHGLAEIAELGSLRSRLGGEIEACLEVDGPVERLSPECLRKLLDRIPTHLLPPIGPCLFAQPCDPRGEMWVANGMFEGTGRMSCRFNVVLDPSSRELYLAHYTARCEIERDGDHLELVDMLFTRGNTVNLHWPQTRRVLLLPGESVDLPPERVLRLDDLHVELRDDLPPRLVSPDGRTIVPCLLTPLDVRFVPTILRFLDTFGAHSHLSSFPFPPSIEPGEGWSAHRRRVVDNLVVERRHWTIGLDAVPRLEPGAEGFVELTRWRHRLGLPEQVYFLEPQRSDSLGINTVKPQYLDFRSPAFTELFLRALDRNQPHLSLVEALPRPEELPLDPELGPRAFEVMIEALAFAP